MSDFLDFIGKERIFATFLTPSEFGLGDDNKRWDTSRNAALSEILGFYGLAYWYAEQVTILGLGPIWQSDNIKAKERAADAARSGRGDGVRALRARARRRHLQHRPGPDTRPRPTTRASSFGRPGEKYYIGNGNVAGMVSVFSRRADVEGPDGYVWFVADSAHPAYAADRQRRARPDVS